MRSPTIRKTLTMLMKAMQTQNWLAALTATVKKLLAMMISRLMALDLISRSKRLKKWIVKNSSSSLLISSDSLTMSKLSKATAPRLNRRQWLEKIQNLIQTNYSSTIWPTKLHKMKNLWSFKRGNSSKMNMRWPLANSMLRHRRLLIRVA